MPTGRGGHVGALDRCGWGSRGREGLQGDAACASQMYGSREDGSIDEDALSSILKTALGVAELAVTDLFQAIDQDEKGRITFGEWRQGRHEGQRPWSPAQAGRIPGGVGTHAEFLPTCVRRAALCREQHGDSQEKGSFRSLAGMGGSFKSDLRRHVTPAPMYSSEPVMDAVLGLRALPGPGGHLGQVPRSGPSTGADLPPHSH